MALPQVQAYAGNGRSPEKGKDTNHPEEKGTYSPK
jgi:hypothetical protein